MARRTRTLTTPPRADRQRSPGLDPDQANTRHDPITEKSSSSRHHRQLSVRSPESAFPEHLDSLSRLDGLTFLSRWSHRAGLRVVPRYAVG